MSQETYYEPNTSDRLVVGHVGHGKGVVVSAWEGSKMQEAVEDEKKFGRKHPDPDKHTVVIVKPKHAIGDWVEVLCWDTVTRQLHIKSIHTTTHKDGTLVEYRFEDDAQDMLIPQHRITATLTRTPT